MGTFRDSADREWEVDVRTSTLIKIEEEVDISVIDILQDPSVIMQLGSDLTLAKILKVVCRKQISERGLAADDFVDAMNQESLAAAREVFAAAAGNFFRDPDCEQVTAILKEGGNSLAATAIHLNGAFQKLMEKMQMSPDLTGLIPEEPADELISGSSSTSVPASAESTPVK